MAEVKRIAIFGPESTGKTTLARRLAEQFGEPWSEEFVREFWEVRGGKITAGDLGTIALGQIANEDNAAARARRVVFCDTDLLTCVLWNDLLFPGACPPWVRAEAEERARGFALYLFCDADVPFVADPQRSFPQEGERQQARERWRETLKLRGLPCVEVRGDWLARETTAVAAVRAVIGAS